MTASRTDIGIYLELTLGEGAAARLDAALAAVPVQAVLIRPGPPTSSGARLDSPAVRTLIGQVQARNAAALIEQDARLARALGADGVHLPWGPEVVETYAEARSILGSSFIVGAVAGDSRHDAMALGEAGADYVGFGGPPGDGASGDVGAARLEQIEWWAEIFEVPCVAFGVSSPDEAAGLARAGADFLGVPLLAGETPATACARIRAVLDAIGRDSRTARDAQPRGVR